jgi:hypothetical protein
MPGIVLVIGFFIYWTFVKRHRKEPTPLTPMDETLIERYRGQIDRELGEDEAESGSRK